MERAGAALGQSADDLADMKAAYDTAAVKKLEASVMDSVRDVLWDGDDAFFGKEGLDAQDGRAEVEKRFQEIRERALVQTKNPRQREMLTTVLDTRLSNNLVDVARHATSQIKVELERQAQARLSGFQQDAIRSFGDPERYAQNIAAGLGELSAFADQRGWSNETLADEEVKFTSSVHTAVINGFLANDDIDGASGWLERYRGGMTVRDELSVRNALKEPLLRREDIADFQATVAGIEPGEAGKPQSFSYRMPVSGKVTSGYGDARGGKSHNGIDIAAPIGSAINPIAPGRVVSVSRDAASGLFVVVDHGDGHTSSYSHMGKQSVKVGDEVSQTSVLGTVGMTGRTTGPHVHLVVRKGKATIDPSRLMGQSGVSDNSARRWDKGSVYDAIEARGRDPRYNWSPEKIDRVKRIADEQIQRDEALEERQAAAEYEAAIDTVDKLGDGFTDVNQIPNYSRLTPQQRISLRDIAKRNAAPKKVAPNGDIALSLDIMAIEEPEKFLQQDLRIYRSQMTAGEYASLQKKAATIRTKPQQEVAFRSAISGTVNMYATPGMNLDGKLNAERRRKVFSIMETWLRGHVKEGQQPTQDQLNAAMRFATGNVVQPATGIKGALFGGDAKTPRVDLPVFDVPPDILQAYVRAFRAETGRTPTDGQIVKWWDENRDRY